MKKAIILLCIFLMMTVNISAMHEEEKEIDLNFNLWCEIFSISLSEIFNADSCRENVKKLLDKGADVNSISPLISPCGTIPLIYAISLFDIELIEILMDSGADINRYDPFLFVNPIHKILDFLEFHDAENGEVKVIAYQILDLLMGKRVDLESEDRQGRSAEERCKKFM